MFCHSACVQPSSHFMLPAQAPVPSMARTLFGDHDRFQQTYFSQYPVRALGAHRCTVCLSLVVYCTARCVRTTTGLADLLPQYPVSYGVQAYYRYFSQCMYSARHCPRCEGNLVSVHILAHMSFQLACAAAPAAPLAPTSHHHSRVITCPCAWQGYYMTGDGCHRDEDG